MTTVEPKIAERRRRVSEDRARKRLRWILLTIAAVSIVVVGVWLVRSPLLSISTIEITNAVRSDPGAALSRMGVEVGSPTIDVDSAAIQSAIEEDPWVDTVTVSVRWPGTVAIDVEEHVSVAPAMATTGWMMLSRQATVLTAMGQLPESALSIDIELGEVVPGDGIDDPLIIGALSFSQALRADLREGAVIYSEGDGLFATIKSWSVRLGRPTDMEQKALVLAALLDQGIDPDATIDLIAPSRPAVLNPQPEVEPEE